MYVNAVHQRPGNALLSKPNQVATSEYGTPASCTTIIAKLIAISVWTAGVSLGVSDSSGVGCDISATNTKVEDSTLLTRLGTAGSGHR